MQGRGEYFSAEHKQSDADESKHGEQAAYKAASADRPSFLIKVKICPTPGSKQVTSPSCMRCDANFEVCGAMSASDIERC